MTETKQSGGSQILKLALVLLAVAAVIASRTQSARRRLSG